MAVLASLMVYFVFVFLLLFNLNRVYREDLDSRLLSWRALWEYGGMESVIAHTTAEMQEYTRTPFLFLARNYTGETVSAIIPGGWESFGVLDREVTAKTIGTYSMLESKILPYGIMISGLRLEDDSVLLVGVSMANNHFFTGVLLRSYPLVFLVIVITSLGVGAFSAQKLLHPIVRLNKEIDLIIVTGELGRRLDVRGSGDQIDELVNRYNRLLDRVESLIKGMTDTLDAISHDLRTPLTRLRGHAELAINKGTETDRNDALSLVMEQTDQVNEILTAIMDMTESDQHISSSLMKRCNLDYLCGQVCEMYSFIAAEKSRKIRFHSGDSACLRGDPGQVCRIIGNLLDNAVKYSPEGGVIDVYTGRNRNEVWLKVFDEGPGIPDEEAGRIFDKLYRLDSSRNSPGLGLGLSVVKALVNAHNGRVGVKSLYGRGSCFEVFFPLFRENQLL